MQDIKFCRLNLCSLLNVILTYLSRAVYELVIGSSYLLILSLDFPSALASSSIHKISCCRFGQMYFQRNCINQLSDFALLITILFSKLMACMAHGVCGAIVIEAVGEVQGYVLALALTPLRNSAVLTAHYSVLFRRLKYAIWWPVLVRGPV